MIEKTLRTLIIDDEQTAQVTLERMLALSCPAISVCGTANSVEASARAIEQHQPDVVLGYQHSAGDGLRFIG